MAVITGTQGTSVSWSLDDTTGILVISGTGAMSTSTSYSSYSWYAYQDKIREVRIGEGVTNIGQYAFYSNGNYYTNLSKLICSSTIQTIEKNSFFGCPGLTKVEFGAGLTTIDGRAFDSCSSLVSITFKGGMPSMPSIKQGNSTYRRQFYNIGNATIYSTGWASDSVFPSAVRGSSTFTYLLIIGGSIIPVNVRGVWRESSPYAKVNGIWKKAIAWCKDNGVWHRIGEQYEGYDGLAVFFEPNGGEGCVAPIQTDGAVTIPDNGFTRSGYAFAGWNTAPDGSGTTYSVGQSVTISANLTLYAIWARQYTISFSANGGSGTVATIVTTSATVTLPSNGFTRSGFKFTGWNTAADGSGQSYAEGQSVTLSADMTLYAIWIQQFTISYYKSFNVSYESYWGSPTNYNGSVTDDNGNYYYLMLAVSGSIVPGLLDSFQSNKVSPTYSVTASKGDLFFIQLITKKGTAAVNEIYINGSRVAGPAQVITWYMDGGVQSNMSIKFEWHTKGSIWSTSDYYWICYITTS